MDCKETRNDHDNPSQHKIEEEGLKVAEGENKGQMRVVLKNRPWTGEEHLLYIIFLEIHKERAKSKLVRHSNSFFKEMSVLVKSKTEIQCRSHHHKYEEKYKYPYRIIKDQKVKLEAEGHSYLTAFKKVKQTLFPPETVQNQVKKEEEALELKRKGTTVSTDCQTSLEGTTLIFLTEEEFKGWYLSHHIPMAHPPYPLIDYSHQMMRMAPQPFFGSQSR